MTGLGNTGLSNQDWECANAYHDGELPPKDARAFERRLAGDPALATALAELAGVSCSLRALHPASAPGASNPAMSARPGAQRGGARRWWMGAGFAATMLLVVSLGSVQMRPVTLLDIHQTFVEQQFDVIGSFNQTADYGAASGQPDLLGANLTPVATRILHDGSVAHYSGRNGCRLSYFRGRGALTMPTDAQTQASSWATVDGVQHAIIATGMDVYRFNAVAAFLKQTTQQRATNRLFASMAEAT